MLRARPACASALRYVTVERSAALREAQHELLALEPFEDALGPAVHGEPDEAPRPVPGVGPIVAALPELPAVPLRHGVVLANELLDNLPFRIVERGTRAGSRCAWAWTTATVSSRSCCPRCRSWRPRPTASPAALRSRAARGCRSRGATDEWLVAAGARSPPAG